MLELPAILPGVLEQPIRARVKEGQLVPSRRENEVKLKVVCGANTQELEDMAGYTIREVKNAMREVLNIGDDHSVILVDGRRVEDMGRFLDGTEELEFKRPAGRKGL